MWLLHVYTSIPISSGPSFSPPSTNTALRHSNEFLSMRSRTVGSKWFMFPSNWKEKEVCPLFISLLISCLSLWSGGVFLYQHWQQDVFLGYLVAGLLPLWWGDGQYKCFACQVECPEMATACIKRFSLHAILCLSLLLLPAYNCISTEGTRCSGWFDQKK